MGPEPSVALYSDGIFSNSMFDSSTPSLFIERTEILRGPQGTLYGRNSIGGTINIVSKRPTEEFQAEVRAMAGNYESYRLDGLMSGPMIVKKIVLMPSWFSGPKTLSMTGWKFGA